MYDDDIRQPRHTWTHTPGSHAGYAASTAVSTDPGPWPFAVDIEAATLQNDDFRAVLWTGSRLQLTVMSIPPGGEIGLEMHPDVDQFIRVEAGDGLVMMGDGPDSFTFRHPVRDGWAFIIPAGWWHNLVNTGAAPVKLYSVYAPPNHPPGTVHRTHAEAEAEHH
jgi:mannose-6-phosphate isomerase-like protein (cupin superfamily)